MKENTHYMATERADWAAFWERWYEATHDYSVGPAVTMVRDHLQNNRTAQRSKYIYETYRTSPTWWLKVTRRQFGH